MSIWIKSDPLGFCPNIDDILEAVNREITNAAETAALVHQVLSGGGQFRQVSSLTAAAPARLSEAAELIELVRKELMRRDRKDQGEVNDKKYKVVVVFDQHWWKSFCLGRDLKPENFYKRITIEIGESLFTEGTGFLLGTVLRDAASGASGHPYDHYFVEIDPETKEEQVLEPHQRKRIPKPGLVEHLVKSVIDRIVIENTPKIDDISEQPS